MGSAVATIIDRRHPRRTLNPVPHHHAPPDKAARRDSRRR